MANRGSINKVQIIGNVVKDPEIKETSPGISRALVYVATNRYWKTEDGGEKEETQFHKIVAWHKLAEICGKLLTKGRKIYVEGRLSTHEWETEEGETRRELEIIMEDLVLLDSRRDKEERDARNAKEEKKQVKEE
ncbi:MAG: single-stranded DNA-binding protein [bacterium]